MAAPVLGLLCAYDHDPASHSNLAVFLCLCLTQTQTWTWVRTFLWLSLSVHSPRPSSQCWPSVSEPPGRQRKSPSSCTRHSFILGFFSYLSRAATDICCSDCCFTFELCLHRTQNTYSVTKTPHAYLCEKHIFPLLSAVSFKCMYEWVYDVKNFVFHYVLQVSHGLSHSPEAAITGAFHYPFHPLNTARQIILNVSLSPELRGKSLNVIKHRHTPTTLRYCPL